MSRLWIFGVISKPPCQPITWLVLTKTHNTPTKTTQKSKHMEKSKPTHKKSKPHPAKI